MPGVSCPHQSPDSKNRTGHRKLMSNPVLQKIQWHKVGTDCIWWRCCQGTWDEEDETWGECALLLLTREKQKTFYKMLFLPHLGEVLCSFSHIWIWVTRLKFSKNQDCRRDFQVHIEAPKLMAWKDLNFQLLALVLLSDIQISKLSNASKEVKTTS